MATWQRWREPLAVTLLAALAGSLVVRVIGLWLAGSNGLPTLGVPWASGPGDLLLVAAVLAALWCSSAPVSPHARGIVVADCVLVGLTIASWLVVGATVIGQLDDWFEGYPGVLWWVLAVLDGLLNLVLPGIALGALVIAYRRLAVEDRGTAEGLPGAAVPGAEGDAGVGPAAPDRSATVEREPRTSPTAAAWQPSDAAGAVWLTADEAAQGAPATGWGSESWAPPTDRSPEVRHGGVSYGNWGPAVSDVEFGGASPGGGDSEAPEVGAGAVSQAGADPDAQEVGPGTVSRELSVAADDDDDLR